MNHLYFSFDTETKTWKTIKPMNISRCRGAVAVVNGCIYVAGGMMNHNSYHYTNTTSNSMEFYEPVDDKWVQLAPMNQPRNSFALIKSNGILYAIGGNALAEGYDPWKISWLKVNAHGSAKTLWISELIIDLNSKNRWDHLMKAL